MEALLTSVNWIRKWAPWCNLIVPVGIILTLGFFHFLYMDAILRTNLGGLGAFTIGAILWALIAGARIAAMFATVSDFSQRDWIGGALGLSVSIALLVFDLWFIGKIAATYGSAGPTLQTFLRFCSFLATGMETRLVLLILDMSPGQNKYKANIGIGQKIQAPQIQQPIPQQRPLVNTPSTNGMSGNGNGTARHNL